MEVEHNVGASTVIGATPDGHYNGRQAMTKPDDLPVTEAAGIGDDEKAAVIGRSACNLARKLEKGTAATLGKAIQGWSAGAAPLPDAQPAAADELPPPLLDGGQGKIGSIDSDCNEEDRGPDDEVRERVTCASLVSNVGQNAEDLTAIRDHASSCATSRPLKLNSVDLPRSETTPTPSSVVPPSGEKMTVMRSRYFAY